MIDGNFLNELNKANLSLPKILLKIEQIKDLNDACQEMKDILLRQTYLLNRYVYMNSLFEGEEQERISKEIIKNTELLTSIEQKVVDTYSAISKKGWGK